MHYIYAALVGDGYLYSAEVTDKDSPEGADYWYSLRHSEDYCPACAGDGDCDVCDDSTVVEGEPFMVYRYGPMTAEKAEAIVDSLDDGGDGYERAAILGAAAGNSVLVLDWTPDYLDDGWHSCPDCGRVCVGDGCGRCGDCEEDTDEDTDGGDEDSDDGHGEVWPPMDTPWGDV